MGKWETLLKNGDQFPHLVGKLDTVWNIVLQFAHLYLIVGKFETVTKVCIQFAHLPYWVGKLDTDFDDGLESAHSV